METRVIKFIAALRASGVRVSLAESEDAFRAIEDLGVKDREKFRLSLQATLIKDSTDLSVFAELFPLFFDTASSPPLMDLTEDLTPEEAQMLAEALREFSSKLREMMERLLKGEALPQEELDRLAQLTGLQQADDLRFREWIARRMERALNFPEVREAIQELLELLAEMGMDQDRLNQMRQLVQANERSLVEQIRQYAGERLAENLSEKPADEGIDALLNRPFEALTEKDLQRLRTEVSRLATVLRTRIALRQKRAKTGQLDAKATIRANLKHGNVPITIKHRDRYLKPRLVVMCDISTSMRPVSELMLSLLYALQDQISKTHAFAFIDHLEYISPDFERRDARGAVSHVLARMPSGYYNTSLGHSLDDFFSSYLDTIDNRTTFILVGDGRNNYQDPRLDLFRQISRRCKRTIWITPEPTMLWGTGDSDIYRYIPYCDVLLKVGTLNELTAAVNKLLSP